MAYHVENIERITEQQIEEEVLKDVENIRVDSNKKVNSIRDTANTEINKIRDSAVTEIGNIKDSAVKYITDEKRDLTLKLGETGIRGMLNTIYTEADKYYKLTVPIAQDTTDEIEENIRKMIVNKGYKFKIVNDGKGNVTVQLVKEA